MSTDERRARRVHIASFDARVTSPAPGASHAIVWLFYPGADGGCEYLKGALLAAGVFRAHLGNRVDLVLLTPACIDAALQPHIEGAFDVHVTYGSDVQMPFMAATAARWGAAEQRWRGVLNKLYVFHADVFGEYEAVMLLDSDVVIRRPDAYARVLRGPTPAGVYENSCAVRTNRAVRHVVAPRFAAGARIPRRYCVAGTPFYHHVNAGLLVVRATTAAHAQMVADADASVFARRFPGLAAQAIHFPEQDYLTNFFAGEWHALDHSFLTTVTTENHIAGKFWETPRASVASPAAVHTEELAAGLLVRAEGTGAVREFDAVDVFPVGGRERGSGVGDEVVVRLGSVVGVVADDVRKDAAGREHVARTAHGLRPVSREPRVVRRVCVNGLALRGCGRGSVNFHAVVGRAGQDERNTAAEIAKDAVEGTRG